nr:MAG TPA: hypothetical protein [Caudoviricetes sp.]
MKFLGHPSQKHPLTRAFTAKHPGPFCFRLFGSLVKHHSSRAFSCLTQPIGEEPFSRYTDQSGPRHVFVT